MKPTPETEAKQGRAGRRSREEIDLLVSEYERSGLSVRAFARERQLAAPSLYGWLRARRVLGSESRGGGFASVVLAGGPCRSAGVSTLRTAMGWQIEVSGMEASYVAELFKAMLPCLR